MKASTGQNAAEMFPLALSVTLSGWPVCIPTGSVAGDAADPPPLLRDVRVLVADSAERVRLRAEGRLVVGTDSGMSRAYGGAPDWVVAVPDSPGRIRVGRTVWSTPGVLVRGDRSGPVTLSVRQDGKWLWDRSYPGALRLTVEDDGRLNVVNNVDVERYVACVVANEVWPTFETEAYRAQAVAARTFVLYQMQRRNTAAFDVSATQGSQVYQGVRDDVSGRRAREAAQYTRGLVLTFTDKDGEDKLFCTYYSAACGGMSQSAAIFGRENDIKPLSGGVRCDYCSIAPGQTYRWGPVRLSAEEVRSRLVAAFPDLASLGRIRNIEIIERTPSGRPVRLRITGSTGKAHRMLAERFRLAIAATRIRSTDFSLRVGEGTFTFANGRGFGHGLGLCQWGMQGQALLGRGAGAILRYYYPGSKLTRAY